MLMVSLLSNWFIIYLYFIVYLLPGASSSSMLTNSSPFHPDVRLKHLPFYDLKKELLKPSSLCKIFAS